MNGQTLPALREDLRLLPGSPDEDGAPRWLLFDAMRNRYFALSQGGLNLIRNWRAGIGSDELLAQMQREGTSVSEEEIDAFAGFLSNNHLIQARSPQASAGVHASHVSRLLGFWRWLLHHYLFVRIPLVRPDRWLARWTPKLEWLFSDAVHYTLLVFGALGFVLVLRQWDNFSATFMHFFNFQGVLLYALALALVKSVHELGHAFTARRLGCRVASMGVALLVLFPVLYTDTTDAWRLRSRGGRLRIVTAGVRAELYLALIATFLWNVLPDGGLRSAAFFIATTSWVTSVLVNISPFMRFDGYYALSDLLGIENLQPRAFAVGRWQLRRLLWGLDDPLPEPMPRQRKRLLVAYAWGTWIYRFFLFLGIALLVYHLFFKVLGIVLFLVEITWFVLLPMVTEMRAWWQRRGTVRWSLPRILGWLLLGLTLLWAVMPHSSSVSVPAVLRAEQVRGLFSPEPARVARVAVGEGQRVARGDLLLELKSDELTYELAKVEEGLHEVQQSLDRIATSQIDKGQHAISEQEMARLRERLHGLQERRRRMQLRAPFDAVATRVDNLQVGTWVHEEQVLVQLVAPGAFRVDGFVSEQDLPLLATGQRGRFVADRSGLKLEELLLEAVDIGAVYSLPFPELATQYGGSVAVRAQSDGALLPEAAHYRVSFAVAQPRNIPLQRVPGVVLVEAQSRSWVWHQLQLLAALLIRESGF